MLEGGILEQERCWEGDFGGGKMLGKYWERRLGEGGAGRGEMLGVGSIRRLDAERKREEGWRQETWQERRGENKEVKQKLEENS